jgi:DNA-binding beta-propeller fold protein YncE
MNQRTAAIVTMYLSLALAGCAVILGRDDAAVPAQAARQIRITYVETLRNEASFGAGRYRDTDHASQPSTSLHRPVAVAADPFRVYVADRLAGTGRLAVFDRSEQSLSFISAPTPTALAASPFIDLSAVAVDEAGTIFVADAQQGRVIGLSRTGSLLLSLGQRGEFSSPSALAVDMPMNRIYVADRHTGAVQALTATGALSFEIGRSGKKGDIRVPVALALDRSGSCYILDGRTNRIHIFDRNGAFLRAFKVAADGEGMPVKAAGIAVDSAGHIYVTDSANHAVLVLAPDGAFLQRWGGVGSRRDEFWTPMGIFIDGRDLIYIADHMNGRVQVYQYEK